MKVKSKISYSGEIISILPWKMAEKLAVEVNIKNVMYGTQKTEDTRTSSFICLGFPVRLCEFEYLKICLYCENYSMQKYRLRKFFNVCFTTSVYRLSSVATVRGHSLGPCYSE